MRGVFLESGTIFAHMHLFLEVFQNSFQNDAKPILNQGILRKNREYCMYLGF